MPRTGFVLRPLLTTALAAGLGLGCVTQGTYDELQAEREGLQTTNARLEQELGRMSEQNDQLTARLAKAEKEVQQLTGTYDQLVGELRQEVESGQVAIKRVAEGISLNVSEELLFGSGQVQLNESGRALLARVADRLQSESSSVWVEGHTDNVPVGRTLKQRYETNWELAGARAAQVVRVLAESGVEPTRLRAVSRGPFSPIASNDSEPGRRQNRRTEIILRPLPK